MAGEGELVGEGGGRVTGSQEPYLTGPEACVRLPVF